MTSNQSGSTKKTSIELIKKHLPSKFHEVASSFYIEDDVLAIYSDIVILILESRAIDTHKDKQNWFNLVPLMNSAQKEKLKAILEKERSKLQEIENKYKKKKLEIQRKYVAKWQQLGAIKKVQEIRSKESAQRASEEQEAENLLHDL